MVTRMGGARRKTRTLMRKSIDRKGKISLTNYFAKYDVGEGVQLVAEPAVQKGLYCLRYYGKHGIVQGMRGACYLVDIKDGGVTKTLIVHPIHLKKVK